MTPNKIVCEIVILDQNNPESGSEKKQLILIDDQLKSGVMFTLNGDLYLIDRAQRGAFGTDSSGGELNCRLWVSRVKDLDLMEATLVGEL